MDEFDFIEEQARRPRRRFRLGAALLNLLTLGIALATLAAGAFYTYIFYDPLSPFNPLPPEVTAEVTATPTAVEETVSPTATETLTETPTATPTETPVNTPTVTPTFAPGEHFGLQEGSPSSLDGSVFHPDLACNFMAVAGQAFGLDDSPLPDLTVRVSGTLSGQAVEKAAVTGTATAYGSGNYYEIELAGAPVASDDALTITLYDSEGAAISDPVTFDTFGDCANNLILINFKALP
jgi:hypothetical protein